MSESGNYSSRSGHDIPSNLPSDVEEDCRPRPVTSQASGNFLSHHHTNIGQNHSERHPLVTGHFSFNRPTVSVFRKPNDDIVPEISNIYDGYKSEAKRLQTFYDWPSNMVVKKEDLARNGFIYLHVNDRAQCVFCRGVLSSWEPGDVVENEHKQHCPECPFAFGYECGNIPVITLQRQSANSNPQRSQPQFYVPSSNAHPQSFNTTVKVPVQAHFLPGELPSAQSNSLNTSDSQGSLPALPSGQYCQVQQNAAQVTTTEPKYRDSGDEYKRVMSFKGWPTQMSQTPIDLAKAGLLYMGCGDMCKCFWCGGELYNWQQQDIPLKKHANKFPNCEFVRAMKGYHNIQYVKHQQNLNGPSSQGSIGPFSSPASSQLRQFGQVRENAAQLTTNEPNYRDWGDEYQRIMSFKGWPTQMSQTPKELAKAGLRYSGYGDMCKCFVCDGELYSWGQQDIPLEKHAKKFPHCEFVRAMKGDDYIQYVKNKQNETPLLENPHVLSVLQEGYTQVQVMTAFNRFGRQTLTNTHSIKQAIEQNKRDTEAMVRDSNRMTGSQQTASRVTLPDEDEEMEVEENLG